VIFHLYHCSLASLRDYRSAPGRNRPNGTGRFPEKPGEADIDYLPPTGGFGDRLLGQLLELFQSIDISNQAESPIKVNWSFLEDQLGIRRKEVRELLRTADRLGLMRQLTIDYEPEAWLGHSEDKGCFVVMTCVEESDLDRSLKDCANAYCDEIDAIRASVLSEDQVLDDVFVVPNGHLAPRAGDGLPWKETLKVLQALPLELEQRGYNALLNSYGYTKLIRLTINAHKIGYVLRVV